MEGSWLCMKFLRGVPVVDKFDEKSLSYQGLNGQKYTLDFFLSAGLQMSTLRKVIQAREFNIFTFLFRHCVLQYAVRRKTRVV